MPLEAFKKYNSGDGKFSPEDTLTVWARQLNYLFSNLDAANISSTTLPLGANQVKASNIDFGVGADQVDASDIPITDSKGFYTGSNIESALQEIGYNLTTTTTSLTLASSHAGFIVCNTTGNITLALPTAVGNPKLRYWIHNINTGTVTIDPIGGQTLDGSTSFDLYQYETLNIFSNNANWLEGG